MRLQELQWDSLTLCEKMYGDKVKAKTVQLWSFAPLDKQPVIYQHSQILLNQDSKKGKRRQYIIPWDEWVPVLESAYDLVDKEASTSYQKPASTAQLVQRTIAMLEQHDIAVNERQLGISPTYVAAYVGLGSSTATRSEAATTLCCKQAVSMRRCQSSQTMRLRCTLSTSQLWRLHHRSFTAMSRSASP